MRATKVPGFRYVGTSFEPAFVTDDGRVRIHQVTPRKWAVYGAGGTRFHKEVSGRDAAIREARQLASQDASEAHATKKSSAQLNREIAEALAKNPRVLKSRVPNEKGSRNRRAAWTTTLPHGEVVSGLLERNRAQLPADEKVHLHYHWAYGRKGQRPAWTMTLPHGEVKSGSLQSAHKLPADKQVHVHYHWAYPGRRSHAQKKTAAFKDIEPGLRSIAQRSIDAENRFIEYAMEHGRLSRSQAATALAAFRKARVIKFDAVNGTFHVKHGQFLDPAVLRRAAGIEA